MQNWLIGIISIIGLLGTPYTKAEEYYPAHIEVKLSSTGDNFYRVIMDESEQPYVSPENMALYLLEMLGECRATQCEFYLPNDLGYESPPYVIDLKSKTCHQLDTSAKPIQSVHFENKWYIHWQSLEQCLPVKTQWSINNYQLTMTRGFKSRAQLEEEIERLRKDTKQKAQEHEKNSQKVAHLPNQHWGASARISTSLSFDEKNHLAISGLSDILVSTPDSLSQFSVDSRLERPLAYYNVAISTNDDAGVLEIGHVLLDGGIFTNNSSLEDGIYYTNRKLAVGFGTLQLENSTKPNIDIDVLVNGIYKNSYRSDSFGRFTIQEQDIAPGDTITFRYFLGEGLWSEEEIVVAGVDHNFLPKGEWSTQFSFGSEEQYAAGLTIDYGLSDYITIGSSWFHVDDTDYLGFQVKYLPAHWLSTQIGWLSQQQRLPIELDLLIDKGHSLSLLFNQKDNFEPNSLNYHKLHYGIAFNTTSLSLNSVLNDKKYQIEPSFSWRINNSLYANYTTDFTKMRDSGESITEHVLNLTKSSFSDTSWSLTSHFDHQGRHQRSHARLRKACSNCWLTTFGLFDEVTANLSLLYQDHELDTTASIHGTINPNVKLSVNGTDDSYLIELTTEFGAKTNFKQASHQMTTWDQYSFAKVVGQVVDEQGKGIGGVKLQLLSQYVTTNATGEFTFDNIPARKGLAIQIDEGSLDLSLSPTQNPIFVDTREVATSQVNIVLLASFGIDGQIHMSLNEKSYIHFKHLQKQTEHSSIVDSDGYYVVEGLTAGDYLITLEVGKKQYIISRKLVSDFWLSGLDFTLEDFAPDLSRKTAPKMG
ncbi:carboxypeptidase-like regulatory domain-containing protein [Vibrio sp. LaRot3]|uniref:carboxypeptidase-like regulatory domain-containing protein n=1 Tax=Vibrio sp. LaRot3 TaxID=2998829 RepID=UPI0022CDDF14|nr:carboxypeptidase-like regulatory domain-containing protein [Vibrio sp. LaRot3]MDA0148229.1 carboxypeptidase-like regulatory domain-containing protein [Vibrio sp. LaRot3]